MQVEVERPAKTPRGYISCPECGINETDLNSLRRWAIDVEQLLPYVFCRSKAIISLSRLVPDRAWRIGKAKWAGRHREILFARRYCGEDEPSVAIISRRAKSILFVSTESDSNRWSAVVPNVVIALESAASTDHDGVAFDDAYVESVIAAAEPQSGAPARRPSRRRGSRVANIEALKKVMMDHIRAARDYAEEKRDLTGEAVLLTCPTKEKFSQLAGLEPYDVTRCFQDPAGRELKVLWNIAHDLDQIMAHRS